MKNLIFLLIPLFFLSSCTIDWNDEKDKKIVSLNTKIEELNKKLDEQKEEIKKVKDDDLFKKNKECQVYLKKMEEEDTNTILSDGFTETRIFYSEVKNSCIYQSTWTGYKDNIPDNQAWKCFVIKNALTNESYNNFCLTGKYKKDSTEAEEAQKRFDEFYENWRTLESFDKALQKMKKSN